MADERFDLIFRGDIVLGQPLADVKQRLQQLFKADAAKIEQLFSGRPVALKRNLDAATAQKYQAVLHKAGALVALSPVKQASGKQDPAAVAPEDRASAARVPLTQPPARPAPSEAAPSSAQAAPVPAGVGVGSPSEGRSELGSAQPTGLTLAPVGGLLLKPDERTRFTPVEVDVTRFSLRPVGADLLDGNERPVVKEALDVVPDFDIAEVGAELLTPDERGALPVMAVEPEDWGLAEVGSDLLNPQERPPQPSAPDVSADFDLAPAGSDMGQLKPHHTPVEPDISGLRLED